MKSASSAPNNEKYLKKVRDAQKAGEEWAKADEKWASRKILSVAERKPMAIC